MANVNENIKILRNRMGITQERFAELVGINRKAVGAYEENRATPPLDKLFKMAKLFGVSIDQLSNDSFTKPGSFAAAAIESKELIEPEEEIAQPILERKKPFSRTGLQANLFEKFQQGDIKYISYKYFDKYILDSDFESKIKDLPDLTLPFFESRAQLRAFDVPVDSGIVEGILIVEKVDFKTAGIDSSQDFLIVSFTKGIFISKLYQKTENVFSTSQDEAQSKMLKIEDIKELWKPVAFFSKEIPKSTVDLKSLSVKINNIKRDLDSLI